jgi:outer membrane protein assembly complex protein YaeT
MREMISHDDRDLPMHATDRHCRPLECRAFALAGLVLVAAAGLALAQTAPPSSVAPPPAPAAKVMVADVVIQGTRAVSEHTVMSYLRTRPNTEYNPDVVQDDARALVATKQFAEVRVDNRNLPDGRVVVTFTLRDHISTIQKIEYQGAKHMKDEDLNTLTGLHLDAPLNVTVNRLACQAIIKRYNEQGRPFADCYLLKGDKPGDSEVVFNITEGPVVKISDIDFTGNTFVSGAVLRTHINSSKKILGLFGGDLNKEMVEQDVAKLVEYYRNFGFHDVRVSYELQYLPDGRNAVLVFHITEGVRYRLKEKPTISEKGVRYATREQLEQLCKANALDWYDGSKLKQGSTAMENFIGYQGVQAHVEAVPVFSPDEPGLVTVHYEIDEKKPARVGQIFIIGNVRTKMNVILRQVGLYPGQILTYPDILIAERNLARLGIFKSSPDGASRPTITVVDGPEGPDSEYKDIIIKVEEDNTGSLLFGIGLTSDSGLQGSVVINERNFDILNPPTSMQDIIDGRAWRGAGQEFRAEAVPGTQVQRYQVSWREPFLFDSLFSLSVSGYYYSRAYNEYTETRLGSRIAVGHKLGTFFENWQEAQFWTFNVSTRIENVGVDAIPPGAPPDITDDAGPNFLIALKAGLTRDTRDSFMRPTEGSLLDLSWEQVGGDHTYPLANVEFSKFWTTYQRNDGSGRHVLAMHNQFSWAGDNTPVYDRFYAGGFRSLRGFEFRGVGPQINGFKVGGDFMFLNSLEYQIPLKADDTIYVVGFVDSGTVETNISHWTNYRVSAGFGVRFVVPILGPVPIALDFGFPIVKGPNDNQQIFSFWIGFFR